MIDFSSIVTLAAGIAVLIIVGFAGIYAARRIRTWSNREDQARVFTLQELRELLKSGQITQAEFESMRGAILGQHAPPRRGDTGNENRDRTV